VDSLLLLRLISRRLDDVRDDDNNDALERERKSVVVVRVKMDKESAFSATKSDVVTGHKFTRKRSDKNGAIFKNVYVQMCM
jgi:hypothetical protein